MDTVSNIQAELERAEKVRARGNEGQARVCARRAAGIAIRAYFARKGTQVKSASAYDLLNILRDDPRLPVEMQQAVEHLTVRVTEEFKLPVHADLIADAQKLCDWLLKSKT